MVSELVIVVRDGEKTLRSKHLIYDTYTTDEMDPVIKSKVDDAIKNFAGEPDSVKINIKILN